MESEVEGLLVVAHELKAPLAVLRQLAFALPDMNNNGEHLRHEMISVSERAIRQVNDLSRVRRLGDGLFRMEPVAVREVCDAVSHELDYLFRENNCGLKIKYVNKSKLVVGNRELLYSVVYNFLLNALHYSDKRLKTELVVRDCGDRVRVSVRDFGPALPIEIWREMKQGFVKKPVAIAMRPGSSGLGLFIASRFSKYMNAEVGAVRHRNGTSFYVGLLKSKQANLFE